MSPFVAALGRPKLTLFLVALATLLGAGAFFGAAQSIFPPIQLSRVEVFIEGADLPPERMRAAASEPIESALQTMPGLHATRAFTTQGAAEIELDFDSNTNAEQNRQRVEMALNALQPSLPFVRKITTIVEHPNMEPVVSYAFTADSLSQAQLEHLIRRELAPTFTGTPALGRITVFGGAPLEYEVRLDGARVARAGLTPHDVIDAIEAAARTQAVGAIDRGGRRTLLIAGGELTDRAALAQVALPNGSLRLRDVATVSAGDGPAVRQASFDARHAVLLNAYAIPGADAATLQRNVAARIGRITALLPKDAHLVKYWDQTRLIAASQASLRNAILIGALLALLVIYLFLRSVAMTAVAAIVIPVAMAISIGLVVAGGMSLNLMSLGGLAIAVGLIIDEVIVVVEAIARELRASPTRPRSEAIGRATRRIAGPLIASTAANVVVFAPLALLSGIPGFFFRALAITLSIALVVSIALSLLVAPLLVNVFVRSAPQAAEKSGAFEPIYGRVLAWALQRPAAVYFGAAAILALTAIVLIGLPSDFLPHLEEGQFEIKYMLPAGTSLGATDRAASAMERIIVVDPDVDHEGRLTGVDTDGYAATPRNAGTIRVALKATARDRFEEIADRLRDALNKQIPSAEFEFHQLLEDQINDLSGSSETIQLAVKGPDQQTLIGIARDLAERTGKIPGVVDPFDGVVYDAQTVAVSARGRGAGGADFASGLAMNLNGVVVGGIDDGGSTIPIRVKPAQSVPLATLAYLSKPQRTSDVNNANGSRFLRVTAGIENANLSAVMERVKDVVAATSLAPGYTIEIGGAYQQQQAAFAEFVRVLGIAVILVFAVLLATFNSFRLPLVILATIPLSPIGVAAALYLTHTSLNVSSFMGLLLLVGIVVRNGILLIDAANRRRRTGLGVREALLAAGNERLRPILMTVLAAISALLPLALGFGSGSEMERPLAIAVIGGLATSTLFTLVVIPVLYAAVSARRSLRVVSSLTAHST
jgi:multidrug efflux pump subunit AcrB